MKKIISLLLALLMLASVTAVLPAVAAEPNFLDKSGWSITASSEWEWKKAQNMIDGDKETHWHSDYVAEGTTVTSHDQPPYTIEITLSTVAEITGFSYTPRQDSVTGRWEEAEIYVSADGKSKGEKAAVLKADPSSKEDTVVSFSKALKAKKVTVVISKTPSTYGACAEIDLLTGKVTETSGTGTQKTESTGKGESAKLNKSGWSITASSEWEWKKAQNMIDGDKETHWHSNYVAEGTTVTSHEQPPYTIEITLPTVAEITGFSYTPRQDSVTGRWEEAEIYVSADGKSKGEKAAVLKADPSSKEDTVVSFSKALRAKKVTVVISKTPSTYGACAEIDLLTGKVTETSGTDTKKNESTGNGGSSALDKSGWSITASSEWEWSKAQNMIDGDKETHWHTNYVTEGTSITSHDKPPYTIEITLPEAKAATGLSYTPRQGSSTGRWKTAEIYVSSDGKDRGEKAAVLRVDSARTEPTIVAFDKERQVKKLTIIVTDAPSTYGSCAELDILTGKIVETEIPFAGFLDTTGWQVKASSEFDYMPIKYAFDDNLNTIWHSYYEHEGSTITKLDTYPYTIDITLPEKNKISGFTLFGRAAQSGRVLAYELYASATDDGEYSLVSSGKVNGTERDEINYGIAFEAKKLRFIVTESIGGYGAIAELKFKEATDEKLYSLEEFAAVYDETVLREVSKNGFNVTCNVETTWGNAKLSNLFDGTSGEWQTGEITNGEPVVLSIDLGKTYVLDAMSVLPRQTQDYHGYWEEFSVWAGTDPDNLSEVIADYSFPDRSQGEKNMAFETPITARYVEIEITKYYAQRVSCGEITFWHSKEDSEKTSGKGKYVMQIGSNEIKVTKSGAESVKTIDTAPFITSAGRTLIPLRGLLEEMGAQIEWVDETQTIIVECDGKKLTLQINYPLVWAEGRGSKAMYTLESAPRIKDSRTFVPLRFLSEQFGYEVTWDGTTQTITIEK